MPLQTCQLSRVFCESHEIVLPLTVSLLTSKAVKLTGIGYCEQWSVISNKNGLEASALWSRDETIEFF